MSAKVETAIWLALKSRVDSLPLPYSKIWPGRAEAVPYDGASLLPYLRIGRVSAAPGRRSLVSGCAHMRFGSLIVTLVHPLGSDISVYDQLAGIIAEHFKDGTQMEFSGVCVTVPSYPHVQDGYEDKGYWTVPIRIPWWCFS